MIKKIKTREVPSRLVGIPIASEMLGIGKTSIFGLIKKKKLDTVLIGRRRLIKIDSIDRLIEDCRSH